MKRMKIVFLLLSMLTVGAAFAGEDEVCQRISSFAGIDVNERRLEETYRFMLKQQVGPFQKCVTTMDWDGAISQLLCHAYFPEVVSYSNIVSQLDQTVPTLSKELDCRLVKRVPTGEGRLKWTLAVNGSDKWAVELCAIELKRQGQLPSRKLATLSIHRPSFVAGLLETESERVPLPKEAPEGDIGEGQDEKWVRATFPRHADMILKKGYDAWLMEWVGIMRQNGHYKTTIHVASLPEGACDFYFGPYHVKIVKPGDYAFPLQVFEKYPIRMKPKIDFTEENDEGFRKREWFYNQSKRRGAKVF